MTFSGFTELDFEVFEVPGLEPRMSVLKERVRPKLEELGSEFAEFLTSLLGQAMFPHVARHARRTVNPPNDTWVAFCTDRRGYKKHPHFQIGLWGTHAFAYFGTIYECPTRQEYAAQLTKQAKEVVRQVPREYVWVPDHTSETAISAAAVGVPQLKDLANRLSRRNGELLVGVHFSREEAVRLTGGEFTDAVKNCFATLKPLYELSLSEVSM